MKKHKENQFAEIFRLFNSQENSAEIIWSSSDSSEFEDVVNKPNYGNKKATVNLINITKKIPNRKRKRKSKVPKNISKLDITIIDSNKGSHGDISSVFTRKTKPKSIGNVLNETYSVPNLPECKGCETILTSPVLCTSATRVNVSIKSPVIAQKFASPVRSAKVRKSLFSETKINNKVEIEQRSVSPIVSHHFQVDRRKPVEGNDIEIQIDTSSDTILETQDLNEFQEDSALSRVKHRNKNDIELIKKVFDDHCNSESSSEVSISDTLTPKKTPSDDLDILTITQQTPNENSLKTTGQEAEKSKQLRYKKGGLAYRLNSILKKHNANISIWEHERFLAEKSNFIIPKGPHMVFRIQKVDFKYGCYLLEAIHFNIDFYQILINEAYVHGYFFVVDSVFKLYEPYQIYNCDENKFIVNVCKFEIQYEKGIIAPQKKIIGIL